MFTKVLIANRGAIACRILRTLRKLGIQGVVVYSEADRHSLHVREADEAYLIGPAPAAESYLQTDAILMAAKRSGAQAIHPGYGFLSENAAFAEACEREGIAFIGPTPEQMRQFGLKHTARALAREAGLPLLPGTELLASADAAASAAAEIGYPVMLKSTAGGGGIGMRLCRSEVELREAFETVRRQGQANFKDSGIYLEKFVEHARHIEVQLFGDGHGKVIALGERDCSVQRRNQKVVEETPAPGLSEETRAALLTSAVKLAERVGYRSAGTAEFVYDADTAQFYFLEVNTRLQVEHGVTEEVTGVDLVEWMVRLASNDLPTLDSLKPIAQGASIQVRIYAEDPGRNFQPGAGLLTHVAWPSDARCETWVGTGSEVSPFYDPMLAKIIVKAETRAAAVKMMTGALAKTEVAGIETNVRYLREIIASEGFRAGGVTTKFLSTLAYHAPRLEVIEAGMTAVQDWPGRIGSWDVGVPPSGPMDPLSFRLANRLVGNEEGAAGLEITMTGPTLRFSEETVVALCGAVFEAELDDAPMPLYQAVTVPAGKTLRIGGVQGAGCRCYLAVRGGLDVPVYLGSRSTFSLGKFGGHAGRALRPGDVIHLGAMSLPETEKAPLAEALRPPIVTEWTVGVLYGPHGAPDFFTDRDITMLFGTAWKIHYNSSRTGVRLIGPKPEWARHDGGEAGLHPSNIHDNAYAVGAVDFTGDMPILLGPDGPSLGGFVCPAVVVKAELWKLGQLKAGDTVRFQRLTLEEAEAMEAAQHEEVRLLKKSAPMSRVSQKKSSNLDEAVLHRIPAQGHCPEVVYRGAGDSYLLVEYGPLELDLNIRFRVHALMLWVQEQRTPGILDLTPGIRSLQIHFDNAVLSWARLLALLVAAEKELGDIASLEVPTRIVHLPLSWDDPATRLAIEKYTQSVRKDAPWCPSNIEFIRRINGLASIEGVKEIVFNASYLVLGLGDVYLGAPVATPVDPRHRLVTTKYNPARTWTAENSVGIGGAYMCIYGMEGPGGYQFVGRTVQVWNTHRQPVPFAEGKPWLLRFFDQIRFFPVTADELLKAREDFLHGQYPIRIEEETFSLAKYNTFLASIENEAAAFKKTQQQAFNEERDRWKAAGNAVFDEAVLDVAAPAPEAGPAGTKTVSSSMPGSIWKIEVKEGDRIAKGQTVVIVEAMKTECAITSHVAGTVARIDCVPGKEVVLGQALLHIKPE